MHVTEHSYCICTGGSVTFEFELMGTCTAASAGMLSLVYTVWLSIGGTICTADSANIYAAYSSLLT